MASAYPYEHLSEALTWIERNVEGGIALVARALAAAWPSLPSPSPGRDPGVLAEALGRVDRGVYKCGALEKCNECGWYAPSSNPDCRSCIARRALAPPSPAVEGMTKLDTNSAPSPLAKRLEDTALAARVADRACRAWLSLSDDAPNAWLFVAREVLDEVENAMLAPPSPVTAPPPENRCVCPVPRFQCPNCENPCMAFRVVRQAAIQGRVEPSFAGRVARHLEDWQEPPPTTCATCGGRGYPHPGSMVTCSDCRGRGRST